MTLNEERVLLERELKRFALDEGTSFSRKKERLPKTIGYVNKFNPEAAKYLTDFYNELKNSKEWNLPSNKIGKNSKLYGDVDALTKLTSEVLGPDWKNKVAEFKKNHSETANVNQAPKSATASTAKAPASAYQAKAYNSKNNMQNALAKRRNAFYKKYGLKDNATRKQFWIMYKFFVNNKNLLSSYNGEMYQ